MRSCVGDELAVVLFFAAMGAVIGSFLNVCILRLPAEQSVVSPPSRCPKCGNGVKWYDNIPVLSWLILRGRCRNCGNPISIQYPLIELATALIWAWMAMRYGHELDSIRAALFLTLLLGIAMTDAREYIIPDEFSIGGLVIGLGLSLGHGLPGLRPALIGAAVGFGVLWLIAWLGKHAFKKEAMGGGDIKMMAMVGAFVGWQGVFLTIFLGSVVGTIVFGPLALIGRKKDVPFGVFLAMGAAVTFLWGGAVLAWYRGYLSSP
jgi:leader peptidase (prepilin peptidase)/N-methyltransferase